MNFRLIALAFVILSMSSILSAQKVNNYDPWGVKIGYSAYSLDDHITMNNFNIDATYNINRFIQVGGSLGYGFYDRFIYMVGMGGSTEGGAENRVLCYMGY